MELFESNLKIERLLTTKIRVPASATSPVGLVVAGFPVRSVANVDLAAGDVPTGGAQTWYIFANRVAASTTFTLSINTSITEGANQRRIGRFYFDGTLIVKDSIRTELSLLITSLLYFKEPQLCQGRLTLSTGVPVSPSDITSSSVLYFTPYNGNRVSLYVPDYGWRVYSFAELNIDISGWTTGKNYDVFLFDNAGTLTLEGVAWSNDTLRATALQLQDGRWCKSGALDRLYLGTIRTSGAGTCADTTQKRFVWNNYNRLKRDFICVETTVSWTYAGASVFRKFNNSSANRLEFVLGLAEDSVFADFMALAKPDGNYGCDINIGLDSDDKCAILSGVAGLTGVTYIGLHTQYTGNPGIGYHYLQLLEWNQTGCTTTFYSGALGTSQYQSGAIGWINS